MIGFEVHLDTKLAQKTPHGKMFVHQRKVLQRDLVGRK